MSDIDLNSKEQFKLLFKHRLRKLLLDANITTLNELIKLSADDLSSIKGVGWVTLVSIEGILSDNGLQLRGKPSNAMIQAAMRVAIDADLIKQDADISSSIKNYDIVQKMIRAALSVRE